MALRHAEEQTTGRLRIEEQSLQVVGDVGAKLCAALDELPIRVQSARDGAKRNRFERAG